MDKQDDIIRVEDRVKIIYPYFVERVGYPMSHVKACDHVIDNHLKDVQEFTFHICNKLINKNNALMSPSTAHVEKRIISALAYYYVGQKRFGGNKRKIYTKYYSKYKNVVVRVDKIKFVKTGIYNRGSQFSGYSDLGYYEEYDPAYLSNEQTHKLLCIYLDFNYYKVPAIFCLKL